MTQLGINMTDSIHPGLATIRDSEKTITRMPHPDDAQVAATVFIDETVMPLLSESR
jgi:hypothetical protein